MAGTGEVRFSIVGIDHIERTLRIILDGIDQINGRLDVMAVSQEEFDAALTDFLSDLDTGLAAIQAKLDEANIPVDLSVEADLIAAAKAKFDAQVAADTTP